MFIAIAILLVWRLGIIVVVVQWGRRLAAITLMRAH